MNALLGGQVDVIGALDQTVAKTHARGPQNHDHQSPVEPQPRTSIRGWTRIRSRTIKRAPGIQARRRPRAARQEHLPRLRLDRKRPAGQGLRRLQLLARPAHVRPRAGQVAAQAGRLTTASASRGSTYPDRAPRVRRLPAAGEGSRHQHHAEDGAARPVLRQALLARPAHRVRPDALAREFRLLRPEHPAAVAVQRDRLEGRAWDTGFNKAVGTIEEAYETST